MDDKTLQEVLTDLLLGKGCTVNAAGVDELSNFMLDREVGILASMNKHTDHLKLRIEQERPRDEVQSRA